MTNIIISAFAVAIAAVYGAGILAIKTLPFGDNIGPKSYPMILLIILMISAVMMAISGARRPELSSWKNTVVKFVKSDGIVAVSSFSILAIYFLAFETLGYLVATALFMLCTTLTLHKGSKLVSIAVSIGFSVASYLIFALVFKMQLPSGILPI